MPDNHAVILVAVRPRYAVWPGHGVVCLSVTVKHGATVLGDGLWLCRRDGRVHELREYRYGMFGGRC